MTDLRDGESIEVKGSGAKPYVLKNIGGVCEARVHVCLAQVVVLGEDLLFRVAAGE